MARFTAADLEALNAVYEWSCDELGAKVGRSGRYVRQNLVDEHGRPVLIGDIPPDGKAWVRIRDGVLIEGRRNHNGSLRFFRRHVETVLQAAAAT